jgi:hypothetical protein
MADFQFGQSHANTSTAVSATGYESLTSHFEFITIVLPSFDCRAITQGGGTPTSQANLDKLIQIVSTRGQPVLMGAVGFGSGNSTVLLAIEHPFAWSSAENTNTTTAAPVYSTGSLAVAGFADPRLAENLAARIALDGTNYSMPNNCTITFNGTLT